MAMEPQSPRAQRVELLKASQGFDLALQLSQVGL